MSTTTPTLGLTLYDSTTDQVVTFATFRAVWGGTAVTSNFYKIDTWAGTVNSSLSTLQNQRGAIPVAASYISANYYEATVASITTYTTGMTILLKLDTDSAGTVTLNISSLGTKSVTKVNSSGTVVNIAAGELQAGRYYLFTYDGTQWIWVDANSSDQIYILSYVTGNVLTAASDGSIDGTLTQSLLLSQTINGATAKTTLADSDNLGITDSAASNVLKKITWSNFKTAIGTALGAIINALSGKTTPVGADVIGIGDSASSFASKLVLLSNLYKSLGTGTQDSTTFLRGDGTYSITNSNEFGFSGTMLNGRISVSVSSNNITVALKTLAGTDPSSSDPVYVRIGNSIRTVTSALSVTKNAGTQWFGLGTPFAAQEQNFFVYLIWNTTPATDIVDIGFARVPFFSLYSEASGTTTNENYLAYGNGSAPTGTDDMVNIGRFSATLSAAASYNWSVPTFTSANLIQRPIYETEWMYWLPAPTGYSAVPTNTIYLYKILGKDVLIRYREQTNGTSNANTMTQTAPFTAQTITNGFWANWCIGVDNSAQINTAYMSIGSGSATITCYPSATTAWTTSGGKRIASAEFYYPISA